MLLTLSRLAPPPCIVRLSIPCRPARTVAHLFGRDWRGAHRQVTTCTFEAEGELEEAAFDSWLEELLWNDVLSQSARAAGKEVSDHEVLRMKGILALKGRPKRYIVQGVRQLYDKETTTDWGEGEARVNRLVFIGRGLNEKDLRDSFARLLV